MLTKHFKYASFFRQHRTGNSMFSLVCTCVFKPHKGLLQQVPIHPVQKNPIANCTFNKNESLFPDKDVCMALRRNAELSRMVLEAEMRKVLKIENARLNEKQKEVLKVAQDPDVNVIVLSGGTGKMKRFFFIQYMHTTEG